MELEIKRGTLRKLDLEIQKLEREISISVHTVTITAIQCFNLCCFCSLYSRIHATMRNYCQINPQVVQALKPRLQKAKGHLDSIPCLAVCMVVGLLWWGLGVRKVSQEE